MGEVSGGIEYTVYGPGWTKRDVSKAKPGEWEPCEITEVPDAVLAEEGKRRVRRLVINGKVSSEDLQAAVASIPGTEGQRAAALIEAVSTGLSAGRMGIKITRADGTVEAG